MTAAPDTGISNCRAGGNATDARPLPGLLGTAALFFAASVVVLSVIDRTHELPFMPMSWYTNRPLWYLLAFASLLAGVFLLRAAGRDADAASATGTHRGPSVFERLVLYTRQGCHLCDEALHVLQQFQQFLPPIQIIDIDAEPSLIERFDTCVPVVEIDGKVRFRGRVNPVLLQRMIDVELARREPTVES